MSDRRQQRRRERQRQHRQGRRPSATYESASKMRLPGIMGWFQSNPRVFYVGGIAVMLLSLGAVFLGSQVGTHSAPPVPEDAATPSNPSAAATATPAGSPAAGATEDAIQRVYASAPPLNVDVSHNYEAVIRTEKGDIRIELLPKEAPGYVSNFIFLAENRFYDGLTFHRVIEGFMAQGGDPTAQGFGGSGYVLPEEKNELTFDAGMLSMAKAGDSVNGSQFFITLEAAPHLNGAFTVFGRVTEGLDVVRALTKREPGQADQPPGDRILGIDVVESTPAGSN
ncbi:MAG: peptidylprolyl isomerase [Dehalococcoidia bacterium]|jgi:cyclophilin family peptidyl-prolyl cis-trans isomerase|nr:peptidylprolyl isomerase [Dehalococcoidia bacterium]